VTPKTILENGWIGIEYGRIAAIESVPRPSAAQVDDHGGALILPGVIDGQTHATSYRGLAGIEETTAAAVACGVTTLVDMPYDNPNSLDRPDRLRAKIDAF
jgi:allantoinase